MFKFKKVLLGLTQAPAHFQQLITEGLRGLSFTYRYLDNILIFHENAVKHFEHGGIV